MKQLPKIKHKILYTTRTSDRIVASTHLTFASAERAFKAFSKKAASDPKIIEFVMETFWDLD